MKASLAAVAAGLCLAAAAAGAQSPSPKDPTVGTLLVATAQVTEGPFRHAVVLLVGLSNKGADGLVLNRPNRTPLPKLFPKVSAAQGRPDVTFAGGPVEPTRLFCLLHLEGRLREAQAVLPGVFVSTSQPLMELALNAQQPAASFRVFQGYAGWAAGQLQRELAAGHWTLVPGSALTIFDPDPATLWSRLTKPDATTPPR